MAEFVAVLFYKQKLERKNKSNRVLDVKEERTQIKTAATRQMNDSLKLEDIMPLTSKIDFMAFVLISFFYAFFHFAYFCVIKNII